MASIQKTSSVNVSSSSGSQEARESFPSSIGQALSSIADLNEQRKQNSLSRRKIDYSVPPEEKLDPQSDDEEASESHQLWSRRSFLGDDEEPEKIETLMDVLTGNLFSNSFEEMEQILNREGSRLSTEEKRELLGKIESLALICRFRNEDFDEIRSSYRLASSSKSDYFNSQIELGKKHRTFSLSVDRSLPVSRKLINWSKKQSIYKTFQDGQMNGADYAERRDEKQMLLFTPIDGRYRAGFEMSPKFSNRLVIQHPKIVSVWSEEVHLEDDESYALKYPDPQQADRYIQLTTVANEIDLPSGKRGPCWVHVHFDHIPPLLSHLDRLGEDLHRIGECLLKSDSVEDAARYKKQFLVQLSHIYWLAVNITPTARGSAQYCLDLLYHELKNHNLPPLIPKRGCSPECIAISTPLEVFQEHFLSLFESQESFERIERLLNSR